VPEDYQLKIPTTLLQLVKACEVNCVASCCGKAAFKIGPEPMHEWIRQQGVHAGRGALNQLERIIEQVGAQEELVM
jgi:hypothetical protein